MPTNFKELVNLGLDYINLVLLALLFLAWFTVFAYLAGYIGAAGGGDEKKMTAARQVALFGILGLVALLVYWGAAKMICFSLLGFAGCR
jgi:EamA domain-containing membrane protein RarD